MEWPRAISYVLPGALVAATGAHAALRLAGAFGALRAMAARQERRLPPLVNAYFRGTTRVLFAGAALFAGLAGADVIVHGLAPDRVLAGILGYGSAVSLMVCAFALLLQGGVDRHLKLLGKAGRWLHAPAGMFGICIAAWGMVIVTRHGGVWA